MRTLDSFPYPLQEENQIRCDASPLMIGNMSRSINSNATEQVPVQHISSDFEAEWTIGLIKTVVTEDELNVYSLQRVDGFTQMVIASRTLQTITKPNITFKNDLFEENVDEYLNNVRKNT